MKIILSSCNIYPQWKLESQFPVLNRVLPKDAQSAAEARKEETFYKGRRDLPIVPSVALPRGERQASYIKNTSNEKVLDSILDITQKMKMESERGAEKFVRCYSLDDDSPKVVLFTDDQGDDLVNFCCHEVLGHKSLLYVDVTFQLGPFLCS